MRTLVGSDPTTNKPLQDRTATTSPLGFRAVVCAPGAHRRVLRSYPIFKTWDTTEITTELTDVLYVPEYLRTHTPDGLHRKQTEPVRCESLSIQRSFRQLNKKRNVSQSGDSTPPTPLGGTAPPLLPLNGSKSLQLVQHVVGKSERSRVEADGACSHSRPHTFGHVVLFEYSDMMSSIFAIEASAPSRPP